MNNNNDIERGIVGIKKHCIYGDDGSAPIISGYGLIQRRYLLIEEGPLRAGAWTEGSNGPPPPPLCVFYCIGSCVSHKPSHAPTVPVRVPFSSPSIVQ